MNDEHTSHAGQPGEGALLIAALRDAANAWTERIRAGVQDGDTSCGVCPICLTVAHLGHEHADLVQRLTEAASALGAAMTAAGQYYQATHPPSPAPGGTDPEPRPGGQRKVQHITVTD